MTIRIAVLGLLLIVPGLQAMDLEFKQESVPAEELEKPATASIFAAIDLNSTIEVARWLNQGINVAGPTERHIDSSFMCISPLRYCATHDEPVMAEYLIARKANVNEKSSGTPLIFCAIHGSTQVAKILLKHKADVQVAAFNGLTALSHSTKNGHFPMTELLLSHRANVEAQDKDGITPLFYAAQYALTTLARDLLLQEDHKECLQSLLLAYIVDRRNKNKSSDEQVAESIGAQALIGTFNRTSTSGFLYDLTQAQMHPANKNLRLPEQLQLRESGKAKSEKLSSQSTADALEGPAQALTNLPNATSVKPVIKKLQLQPLGRMTPQIKTQVSERHQ